MSDRTFYPVDHLDELRHWVAKLITSAVNREAPVEGDYVEVTESGEGFIVVMGAYSLLETHTTDQLCDDAIESTHCWVNRRTGESKSSRVQAGTLRKR